MNRRYMHRDLPPTPGMGAIKVDPPKVPPCPKEMYGGIYETIPAVGTSSSSSITDELHHEIICNEDDMPIYPQMHHSPHHSPHHAPHHAPYNSPGKSNHRPAAHQQNRPFSYTTQLMQLPHFQRQNEQYHGSTTNENYSDSAYEPIPGDSVYAYTQIVTRTNGHESPNNGNVQYRPEHFGHSDNNGQPTLPVRTQQTNRRAPPAPPIHPPPSIVHGKQSPKLPRQSHFQEVPMSPKSPVLSPKNFPNLRPTPTTETPPPPPVTSPVPKALQKKTPTNIFPAPPPPVPVHVGMAAQMAQQRSPSPPLPPLPPELHHDQVVSSSPKLKRTQDVVPPPPPNVSSIPARLPLKSGQGRQDISVAQGGRSSPVRGGHSPKGSIDVTESNTGGLAAELAKVKLTKKEPSPAPTPPPSATATSSTIANGAPIVRLRPTPNAKVDIYRKETETTALDTDPPLPPPPAEFTTNLPPSAPPTETISTTSKPVAIVVPSETKSNPWREQAKSGAKGNSTMDINIDDIDLNQVPGYAPIPDTCPNWKRDMYERKNREKVEAYLEELKREKEEEEKWKDIPAWKRRILKEKERDKGKKEPITAPKVAPVPTPQKPAAKEVKEVKEIKEAPKAPIEIVRRDSSSSEEEGELPPWKAELLKKRGGAAPKNWGDEREDMNKEGED